MKIALEYQPLNLGQGLPDDLVPNYVVDSLADVMKDPNATLQQVRTPKLVLQILSRVK